MRLDASGNLLVGKTTTNTSVEGHELRSSGQAFFTGDAVNPVALNRLTSDGNILVFNKDGTTVGSIGSRAGYVTIGKGDVGLLFQDANNRIEPNNQDGLTGSDGVIDLGSSATRFKDLYLSSTAYVTTLAGVNDTNSFIRFEGSDVISLRTGNSERLRVDGSGNVGIGTSSPTYELDVVRNAVSSRSELYVGAGTTGANRNAMLLSVGSADTVGADYAYIDVIGNANRDLSFRKNGTSQMILDSSGNLLVGKTSLGVSTVGGEIRASGQLSGTVASSACAALNRTTTDGNIAEFYKDGTLVGSIGTTLDTDTSTNSELFFTSGNTGLLFDDTANFIRPCNLSGAARDNIVDLGEADNRFKDLYLSGGVYVGGTGAANYLDDYEEGTWTPTIDGVSSPVYSIQSANYTKIGNLVTITLDVDLTSGTPAAANLGFSGLPFTANGTYKGGCVTNYQTGFFTSTGMSDYTWHIQSSNAIIRLYNLSGGNVLGNDAQVTVTERVILHGHYYTA